MSIKVTGRITESTVFPDGHTITRGDPKLLKKEAWDRGIQISGWAWKLTGPLVNKHDTYHSSYKRAFERLNELRERKKRAHENMVRVKKAGLAKAAALEQAVRRITDATDREAVFLTRVAAVRAQYDEAEARLNEIRPRLRTERELLAYVRGEVTFDVELDMGPYGKPRIDTHTDRLDYLNSIKD